MLQGNTFCPCERNAASGKHVTGHVEWRMANTSEANSRGQRSDSLGSALDAALASLASQTPDEHMNFRRHPVGNGWAWHLREDDNYVITIAGARFSTVAAALRFGSTRFLPSVRGFPSRRVRRSLLRCRARATARGGRFQ